MSYEIFKVLVLSEKSNAVEHKIGLFFAFNDNFDDL